MQPEGAQQEAAPKVEVSCPCPFSFSGDGVCGVDLWSLKGQDAIS